MQVNEQIANDNRVFTLRTWTGKKKRKENSMSPANKYLVRTEASVVTIGNNKIIEDWVVRGDFNELLKQWLRYVQPDEYLSLWQFYQNRADQVKDRLWTSGTLHFTILAVILGFSADKCLDLSRAFNNWVINVKLLIALSVLGLLFSYYRLKFVKNYGKHINSNWDKADELRSRIVNLNFKDHNKGHDDSKRNSTIFEKINERFKIPYGDARHLYWITACFFLVYVALLCLCIFT